MDMADTTKPPITGEFLPAIFSHSPPLSFSFVLVFTNTHSHFQHLQANTPLLFKQQQQTTSHEPKTSSHQVQTLLQKNKNTAAITNNRIVASVPAPATIASSDTTPRTIISLSHLLFEALLQVAGYLSRRGIHARVHVNWSLSKAFVPYWQDLDLSLCDPQTPELSRLRRFRRLRSFSTEQSAILPGALAEDGLHIRPFRSFYIEWLESFGPEACVNLGELEVTGYVRRP